MSEIDTRWVDCDFAYEARARGKTCGLIPQTAEEMFAAFPCGDYETDMASEMIPRSQWPDWIAKRKLGMRRLIRWTRNQKSEGSCVGQGFTTAVQLRLALEYGLEHEVNLSAMSVYDRIGRSSRSGAMLSDGAKAVQDGILPLDTPANIARFGAEFCKPATGFRGDSYYRDGRWLQVGKNFCADRLLIVRGMDAFCSAIFRDHFPVVGRSAHCVCHVDVVKSGNDYFGAYHNSWGDDWGDPVTPDSPLRGIGYDSERILDSLTCYVIVSVARPTWIAQPEL